MSIPFSGRFAVSASVTDVRPKILKRIHHVSQFHGIYDSDAPCSRSGKSFVHLMLKTIILLPIKVRSNARTRNICICMASMGAKLSQSSKIKYQDAMSLLVSFCTANLQPSQAFNEHSIAHIYLYLPPLTFRFHSPACHHFPLQQPHCSCFWHTNHAESLPLCPRIKKDRLFGCARTSLRTRR